MRRIVRIDVDVKIVGGWRLKLERPKWDLHSRVARLARCSFVKTNKQRQHFHAWEDLARTLIGVACVR